LTLITINSEGV